MFEWNIYAGEYVKIVTTPDSKLLCKEYPADRKLVYADKASMDIFDCKDFEKGVAGRSAFGFMPEIQPNGRTTADGVERLRNLKGQEKGLKIHEK